MLPCLDLLAPLLSCLVTHVLPDMQLVKEKADADLLVLPTDAVLFEDAEFKVQSPVLCPSSFASPGYTDSVP